MTGRSRARLLDIFLSTSLFISWLIFVGSTNQLYGWTTSPILVKISSLIAAFFSGG